MSEVISKHRAKVTISKNLMAQIQYLHSRCPKNHEWSALLVYKLEQGSLEDLSNIIIRAEGLFPMDYGDSAFTSFEGDENWLKCFQQYPQVDPMSPQPGWYIGKIHDHPHFSVFHSGTDKNDLYTTAPKLPMYLSLIVNYATETDCELAISMEMEEVILSKTSWKLKGWKNKEKTFDKKKQSKASTLILKCDVVYEQDQWMIDQCNFLKTKPKPITTTIPTYNIGSVGRPLGTTYVDTAPPTVGSQKDIVRKFVIDRVHSTLSDLVSIGHLSDHPLKEVLTKVDAAIEVGKRDVYKKAVKQYFLDMWYPSNFYNVDSNEEEVIQGVLRALSLQNGWLVTTLNNTMNELKKECTELWAL